MLISSCENDHFWPWVQSVTWYPSQFLAPQSDVFVFFLMFSSAAFNIYYLTVGYSIYLQNCPLFPSTKLDLKSIVWVMVCSFSNCCISTVDKFNDTHMRLKGVCYFIHVTGCLQFSLRGIALALAHSVQKHWVLCTLFTILSPYLYEFRSYVLNQQISLFYDFYQDEAIDIIWHTTVGPFQYFKGPSKMRLTI